MAEGQRFKIEKRVPLVGFKQREGYGRVSKYPMLKLRVGDSFAIEDARTAKLVRAACWALRKSWPEYNFTVRQMTDGTYRCWRIKAKE